jgi:hypothetical protein
MHLRRKGENAESRTICPTYVSSGFPGVQTSRGENNGSPEKEEESSFESGEQPDEGSSFESGEQPDSWQIENGEQAPPSTNRKSKAKGLRESRKTPFRRSPLPRGHRAVSPHWRIKTPPPVSDDDSELSAEELREAIVESTDMSRIDYSGEDAMDIMLADPFFQVLRKVQHASLVLFSDGVHGVCFNSEVDIARAHHAGSSAEKIVRTSPPFPDDEDLGSWKRNARRTNKHCVATRQIPQNERERSSRTKITAAERSGPRIWWRGSDESESAEDDRCRLHSLQSSSADQMRVEAGGKGEQPNRKRKPVPDDLDPPPPLLP